jgi:hypothetical protein
VGIEGDEQGDEEEAEGDDECGPPVVDPAVNGMRLDMGTVVVIGGAHVRVMPP